MADSLTPILHVEVTVSLNYDTSYRWSDPNASETLSFHIPPELADLKKVGEVINGMVKLLPQKLEVEKQKWEIAQAEKEAEAEKAE